MEGMMYSCCTIVSVDTNNLSYAACGRCERALSESPVGTATFQRVAMWRSWACHECQNRNLTGKPFESIRTKQRQFKLRLGLQVEEQVVVAVAFDKAASALIGCSADQWWSFASHHPGAAHLLGETLEGLVCSARLRQKTRGDGHELRVAAITPLSTGWQPPCTIVERCYAQDHA